MAEISAQLVKNLRERTGAGMMECKKALVEAGGDMEKAVDVLRTRGLASAGKKEGRSTKQGVIGVEIHGGGKSAVMVEVNCESDFVARTEDFQELVKDITAHIAALRPTHVRREDVNHAAEGAIVLYEQAHAADKTLTVGEVIKNKIAKLGENIAVSRFTVVPASAEPSVVGAYIHAGAQLATLLELTGAGAARHTEELQSLVRDIAMQVAAANPQFIDRGGVDPRVLDKERGIQRERALAEGKPEKMVDKIVEGRLAKFYEEVCLLEQPFIKDNAVTIAELLKSHAAGLGGAVAVKSFVRYKVGDAGDTSGAEAAPLPVTA